MNSLNSNVSNGLSCKVTIMGLFQPQPQPQPQTEVGCLLLQCLSLCLSDGT